MPRAARAIPDELLLAHLGDRQKLSDELWVIPPQVGMLLGRSPDQLEEDRKTGTPPPAMKPWGEKGPVRYRLGTVRDWMLGPAGEEYANTRQAKLGTQRRETAGLGFVTFNDFLDDALPADEWPFLVRKNGPPVDFFKSLSLGDALRDDDECAWLRLEDYLELRLRTAREAEAGASASSVGDAMSEPTAEDKGRVRV
jgi:hypothetical protein